MGARKISARNKSKGFASSGITVGRTPRSNRERRNDHLKGNKVTMGKNIPRHTEGAVGDITVRDIATIGLRCYIKTNSGWYDIHALQSPFVMDWRDIIFTPTGVISWLSNVSTASGEKAQYAKDQNGMVHLRGSIRCLKLQDTTPAPSAAWQTDQDHPSVEQSGTTGSGTGLTCRITTDGSGDPTIVSMGSIGFGHVSGNIITFTDPGTTTNTITVRVATTGATLTTALGTLPPGYRPYGFALVPSAPLTSTRSASLKISSAGVMTPSTTTQGWSATLSFLDGIGFFAKQFIGSAAQGGSSGGPGGIPPT